MNCGEDTKDLLFVVFDIHFGGGGERVTANIVNHYHNKGFSVEILSFGEKKNIPIVGLAPGIRTFYLSTSSNKFLQKIQTIHRIKKFFKSHRYSFVIGIGSYPSVVLGLLNHKGCFFIGTEHSHFYNAGTIWNYLRRFTYPNLSAIVVLTRHDYKILKEINNNTYVIPNAQSFTPQSFSSCENHRFLAVGRMDRFKQYDQMLKVFYKFSKLNDSWELVIVGGGELLETLKTQVKELNLEDRIYIKTYTDHIEKEYLSASVLLSTSQREGLPMVMIEAMSYGLPVVAYDCKTGPSDIIIDKRNGYLVPLDDDNMLLERMLKLSADYNLRKQMSKNAIEDAQRFSPQKVYGMWDSLFDQLSNK